MVYAETRKVVDTTDCFFYHVMDLPGAGQVGGQWDLRDTIDEYVGRFDFQNKRVLDIGAASGYVSFEMEKRGADVVSFDMAPDGSWDIVPHHRPGFDLEAALAIKRKSLERLTNAYWFAHAALSSRARVCYGDIYDIPSALGVFDVAFLGSVLLHLRDPFQALYSAAQRCRDTLIVTDMLVESRVPTLQFRPRAGDTSPDTWWYISESCLRQMLEVLGFKTFTITRSKHLSVHGPKPKKFWFYTCVATGKDPGPAAKGDS